MTVECVLDTNVLLYAVSNAQEDAAKRTRVLELIALADFGVSTQVLQEFYVNATRKIRVKLSPSKALEWIEQLAEQPCMITDATLVKRAIELSVTYQVSYWDGAIIAAAEALGASTVYTEDLNHGQQYGSVRVINPFRPTNPSALRRT
jgi:predicted nucleic acid-binding protein